MKLKDFISKVGNETASKTFDVPIGTIKSWRHGVSIPKPERAKHIVKVSRGMISWEDIYGDLEDVQQ